MAGDRLLISGGAVHGAVRTWPAGWLVVDDGRIALMGPGEPPEFASGTIARHVITTGCDMLPGFIDLHVHGAVDHEAMDASGEGLLAMARFYAQHGVTSFLPTTWTGSRERTDAAVATIAAHTEPVAGGATIVGAHLEGPYLNPQRCGAQDPRYIRRADRDEALRWLDTGVVRLLALAPEYPESLWLIAECVRRGVTVSAAHTAATYDDMLRAAELGLRQATHTFNAMNGLHHRDPGTVGAAFTLPDVACELIADGIHVHPAVMRVLLDVKGVHGVILVSDAIRAAGMPEGDYPINDQVVHVKDGSVRFADGTLAGSILTLDVALRNVLHATQRPLSALWPVSSLNAARAIGLSSRTGSLEVGKDADLVVLDAHGDVCLTVARGQVVYERS